MFQDFCGAVALVIFCGAVAYGSAGVSLLVAAGRMLP